MFSILNPTFTLEKVSFVWQGNKAFGNSYTSSHWEVISLPICITGKSFLPLHLFSHCVQEHNNQVEMPLKVEVTCLAFQSFSTRVLRLNLGKLPARVVETCVCGELWFCCELHFWPISAG